MQSFIVVCTVLRCIEKSSPLPLCVDLDKTYNNKLCLEYELNVSPIHLTTTDECILAALRKLASLEQQVRCIDSFAVSLELSFSLMLISAWTIHSRQPSISPRISTTRQSSGKSRWRTFDRFSREFASTNARCAQETGNERRMSHCASSASIDAIRFSPTLSRSVQLNRRKNIGDWSTNCWKSSSRKCAMIISKKLSYSKRKQQLPMNHSMISFRRSMWVFSSRWCNDTRSSDQEFRFVLLSSQRSRLV